MGNDRLFSVCSPTYSTLSLTLTGSRDYSVTGPLGMFMMRMFINYLFSVNVPYIRISSTPGFHLELLQLTLIFVINNV